MNPMVLFWFYVRRKRPQRAQQEGRVRQAREAAEARRRNRHSALYRWTGGRIGK
jgi:hypothetical protein